MIVDKSCHTWQYKSRHYAFCCWAKLIMQFVRNGEVYRYSAHCFSMDLEVNVYKEEKRACKLIFNCIHYVVASQLIGKKPNYKNYGIKKISSIKITSSDIKKLQVIFTKRLSFKPTFKGHSIITCLNHMLLPKTW